MSDAKKAELRRCVSRILSKYDYERRQLDQTKLKELKGLVRPDDTLIRELAVHICEGLKVRDSDKRLCLVLLTDFFFQRSHAFRSAIIDRFQDFLLYTVELNRFTYPLPGPADAAALLKRETLQIVKLWNEKFGRGYAKLENTQNVLLSNMSFDYVHPDDAKRRATLMGRQRHERVIRQVETEFNESKAHIQACIAETRTALSLLVPDFREGSSPVRASTSSPASAPETCVFQNRGLQINVPTTVQVKETNDNAELIGVIMDAKKLLQRNSKDVARWMELAAKHYGSAKLIQELLVLRDDLVNLMGQVADLKVFQLRKPILRLHALTSSEDSDTDEMDFSEVDLTYEDPEGLGAEMGIIDVESTDAEAENMGMQPKVRKQQQQQEAENREKQIPTLAYGLDLKYWGDEHVKPAELPIKGGHRFWCAVDNDRRIHEPEDAYKLRVSTFVTDMPPVTRTCRAPLVSGKLCPRMDRVKCPVHGLIIDRDEHGKPTNPSQAPPLKPSTVVSSADILRQHVDGDPDTYYRMLEEQSGGKFSYALAKAATAGKKLKGVKKREKPAHVQSRNRLKSKLLNKRVLKRISDTLDYIQKSKAEKRFGAQFNY